MEKKLNLLILTQIGVVNQKKDGGKRMMEIVREEAQKIIDDPSRPETVKARAREFLEKENKN
jgi:hypothetical protein